MAYVLDNEPVPGIGTSMNTGGPNLGLGALGTGLLLAYVGFTGADAFLVLVLALGCTAVAIAVSPERWHHALVFYTPLNHNWSFLKLYGLVSYL